MDVCDMRGACDSLKAPFFQCLRKHQRVFDTCSSIVKGGEYVAMKVKFHLLYEFEQFLIDKVDREAHDGEI